MDGDCHRCLEGFSQHCVNLACPIGYGNVYNTHPEECEKVRDPIEEGRNQSYSIGHVGQAETYAALLRTRSGAAFAEGRDDEAKLLRGLAKDTQKDAERLRREYDIKYPKPKRS